MIDQPEKLDLRLLTSPRFKATDLLHLDEITGVLLLEGDRWW